MPRRRRGVKRTKREAESDSDSSDCEIVRKPVKRRRLQEQPINLISTSNSVTPSDSAETSVGIPFLVNESPLPGTGPFDESTGYPLWSAVIDLPTKQESVPVLDTSPHVENLRDDSKELESDDDVEMCDNSEESREVSTEACVKCCHCDSFVVFSWEEAHLAGGGGEVLGYECDRCSKAFHRHCDRSTGVRYYKEPREADLYFHSLPPTTNDVYCSRCYAAFQTTMTKLSTPGTFDRSLPVVDTRLLQDTHEFRAFSVWFSNSEEASGRVTQPRYYRARDTSDEFPGTFKYLCKKVHDDHPPFHGFRAELVSEGEVFSQVIMDEFPFMNANVSYLIGDFLGHVRVRKDIYFDLERFENQILWGGTIPPDILKCIMEIARQGHGGFLNAEALKALNENACLPVVSRKHEDLIAQVKASIAEMLESKTELYRYQMHTVSWMFIHEHNIERHHVLNIGATDLRFTNHENVKCRIGVDHVDDRLFFIDQANCIPQRVAFYKGGVLADSVGLGKTLTVLSLIAGNPLDGCQNGDSLVDGQAVRRFPKVDTFRCACSLIIVPPHLVEQWADEAKKHFGSFRVLTITTQRQHERLPTATILSARVLIVSAAFLTNKRHYGPVREKWRDEWERMNPQWADETYQPQFRGYRRSRTSRAPKCQDLSWCAPPLSIFHWRRVILDEPHEFLEDDNIREIISEFDSEFRWYVSGTPFPSRALVKHCAEFLKLNVIPRDEWVEHEGNIREITPLNWDVSINTPVASVLKTMLCERLFSRNTSDSIADENHMPAVETKVQWVDFHPVERAFYDMFNLAKQTRECRSLCSGLQPLLGCFGGSTKSIPEEGVDIEEIYLDGVGRLKAIIATKKRTQAEEESLLVVQKQHSEIVEQARREWRENPNKSKKNFSLQDTFGPQKAAKYRNVKSKVTFTKRRITKLKKDIAQKENQLKLLADNKSEAMSQHRKLKETEPKLVECISKYGSKQAHIFNYIAQILKDPKTKIILFSQFNHALRGLTQALLGEYQISCVKCVGNVMRRSKALREFKSKPTVRVLSLSLENAASGADLTSATHVILVDPVAGSSTNAYACERQAIGRAVRQGMDTENACQVVRFVVRNSTEEGIYRRNKASEDESFCGW